ncbi:Serine/threonine-protein kinase par-1 [Allomyces javanicus]|nr:Serine/threonine-protein kinase par-1 [Allomyces javanicus]
MASKPSSSSAKSPKKIAEETNPDFQLPGIGNYAFVKTLGEGNFAKVKLAKHKMTGQEVAIKIIDKTQLDEKKLNKLYREVRIMKTLHHPHIVRLYEVIETKSTVFLVMEYSSGGELYDYLVVHGRMKEKEARAKFRQILSAVSYCHKKRVIHRDLKAENLLLDTNLDIKIADFGFSNQFDPEGKLDTFCGSPPYAAPELFQGRRYVGPEVDVWSLGVILYVLTTGCLPFDGKNLQEMRESVCRGKYRIPFYLSDSCEKLLRKFLVRDPTKRASLDIIADDPWLNEGYTEPPICNDLSMKISEDENLIKMIELKFHIERDVIVKSLRDNVYDDISALYYLMYHERDRTGDYSRVNQVLNGVNVPTTALSPTSGAVSPPPSMMPMSAITLPRMPASAPSSAASSPVKPSANPGVSAPTSPVSDDVANAGKTMVAIAEDAVLPSGNASAASPPGSATPLRLPPPSASTARAVSTTPRRRRFTVGSEQPEVPAPPGAPMAGGVDDAPLSAGAAAEKPGTAPAPVAMMATHTSTLTSQLDDMDPRGKRASGTGTNGAAGGNLLVGMLRSTLGRSRDGSAPAAPPPMGLPSSPSAPAAGDDGKPRSLRFTFNSNTTSSKPPDEVVALVLDACVKLNVQHKLISRYLMECAYAVPQTREMVRFEVEVCKLPRLKNLHGLKFKRLAGPSNDYKVICENLLANVSL